MPKHLGVTVIPGGAVGSLSLPRTLSRNNKVALLIGIEYTNYASKNQLDRLPGCHSDVFIIRDLLIQKFAFQSSNITVLSDASPLYTQPTKSNILQAMQTLVTSNTSIINGAASQLVVYYSGHGTQQQNVDGKEVDGKDECIVPCDFQTAGMITDNVLSEVLLSKLPKTVKCTLIADSCNSGTLYDLPWIYNKGCIEKSPDKSDNVTQATVFTLSGCRDEQTSASAYNLERRVGWRGAMTVALEEVITGCKREALTLSRVVEGCRQFLASNGYKQVPQLCTSAIVNPNEVTFL